MQGSRLKTHLSLIGLFLALLVIAAAGWVVRPFIAMARWAPGSSKRVLDVANEDDGRRSDAGLRQLSARLSAGDGFLVAARALGLVLLRQVAGLVPAPRQLAHAHRAVLRVGAAATTHVPGYDLGKRVRAAVVHRHGVWIMPLPLR
jgi:hypothetical protein